MFFKATVQSLALALILAIVIPGEANPLSSAEDIVRSCMKQHDLEALEDIGNPDEAEDAGEIIKKACEGFDGFVQCAGDSFPDFLRNAYPQNLQLHANLVEGVEYLCKNDQVQKAALCLLENGVQDNWEVCDGVNLDTSDECKRQDEIAQCVKSDIEDFECGTDASQVVDVFAKLNAQFSFQCDG